jgi:enoyl-CoA hydratase/carnithine racemase
MTEAHVLARRLMKAAPLAQRATKEIARRGLDNDLLSAVRFGETMRRVAAQTEDAAAFRASALKGERPDWQGR